MEHDKKFASEFEKLMGDYAKEADVVDKKWMSSFEDLAKTMSKEELSLLEQKKESLTTKITEAKREAGSLFETLKKTVGEQKGVTIKIEAK